MLYEVITDFDFAPAAFTWLLAPLAIAGMFFASIVAIFQDDVKRMLAYSSVGQIGYMLLGVSFGTEQGLTASLVITSYSIHYTKLYDGRTGGGMLNAVSDESAQGFERHVAVGKHMLTT